MNEHFHPVLDYTHRRKVMVKCIGCGTNHVADLVRNATHTKVTALCRMASKNSTWPNDEPHRKTYYWEMPKPFVPWGIN